MYGYICLTVVAILIREKDATAGKEREREREKVTKIFEVSESGNEWSDED